MATKTKKTEEKPKTEKKLPEIKLAANFKETGNIYMDMALSGGKGMPLGASILLFAPPGTGKTTIVADTIRSLLKKYEEEGSPNKVLFIDVEDSSQLLSNFGLQKYLGKSFLYRRGMITFEELEPICSAILGTTKDADMKEQYKDVKVIVIDSLSSVQSKAKLEKDIGAGDFGSNAKERGEFYTKYLPLFTEKEITQFYIAQVRKNITQMPMVGAPDKKSATTDADKHWSHIIMNLKPAAVGSRSDVKGTSKSTQTLITGEVVELADTKKILITTSGSGEVKNRYGCFPDIKALLRLGVGTSNVAFMFDVLSNLKYLTEGKNSKCYKFSEEYLKALGEDKIIGVDDLTVKEARAFIREHLRDSVGFLKSKDQYKLVIKSDRDDDDGLF
jgi:RecA/RadA recombinase